MLLLPTTKQQILKLREKMKVTILGLVLFACICCIGLFPSPSEGDLISVQINAEFDMATATGPIYGVQTDAGLLSVSSSFTIDTTSAVLVPAGSDSSVYGDTRQYDWYGIQLSNISGFNIQC